MRYWWTFSATGNRGVSGGKANEVYAMTGWGRFVVRQSYRGVRGGSADSGGAGSLERVVSRVGTVDRVEAYQMPPISSRDSKAIGVHSPDLYCSLSKIVLRAASPAGPAPMTHIVFWLVLLAKRASGGPPGRLRS